MNKKYIGKTPEEILSMMTLREKVAQTIVTGIGNIEEGKMVAERGFWGISAIWGHDKESMKRFRKDVDELQEISDIPLLIGTDMETGIAVSYTHLDVYKRQVLKLILKTTGTYLYATLTKRLGKKHCQ